MDAVGLAGSGQGGETRRRGDTGKMAQDRLRGGSVASDMGRAEIGEPGGGENRTCGICECGCGAKLTSQRGKRQRWASNACRMRALRQAQRERQGKRRAGHQMIDLGKMTIPERQAALAVAAYMVGLR